MRPEEGSTPGGHINRDVKSAGARSAGNSHAACDVAGVGDGITELPKRARRWKRRIQPRNFLRIYAPALDPTSLIREALIDLEHHGFVQRTPFSGTQVSKLTLDDARQMFDLRMFNVHCSIVISNPTSFPVLFPFPEPTDHR
jgi:hypothetical protein